MKKTQKKVVPKLKKKKRRHLDPDSMGAALNWVSISDPGDGARPGSKQ